MVDRAEVQAWMDTAAALTAERDALRAQLATCAADLLAARQVHPAAQQLPRPTGQGTDVHAWLMEQFDAMRQLPDDLFQALDDAHIACAAVGWDTREALEARAAAGRIKYGVPLMTRNGRDPRIDYAQESLDALHYAAQAGLEGEGL